MNRIKPTSSFLQHNLKQRCRPKSSALILILVVVPIWSSRPSSASGELMGVDMVLLDEKVYVLRSPPVRSHPPRRFSAGSISWVELNRSRGNVQWCVSSTFSSSHHVMNDTAISVWWELFFKYGVCNFDVAVRVAHEVNPIRSDPMSPYYYSLRLLITSKRSKIDQGIQKQCTQLKVTVNSISIHFVILWGDISEIGCFMFVLYVSRYRWCKWQFMKHLTKTKLKSSLDTVSYLDLITRFEPTHLSLVSSKLLLSNYFLYVLSSL